MDDLSYQALDEIRITGDEDALDVQYSEPDQGGTRLLLRYRIPRRASRLPIMLSGYAHEGALGHGREVPWSELPSRVARDLLPWLASQRRAAQAARKAALDSFLADIESLVESRPT